MVAPWLEICVGLLWALSTHIRSSEAAKFVEYAGGAGAIVETARTDYAPGEYGWVATALNHVVFATRVPGPGETGEKRVVAGRVPT